MLQMDQQNLMTLLNRVEAIMKELGFPRRLIKWIMLTHTIISYKFRVNGEHIKHLREKWA